MVSVIKMYSLLSLDSTYSLIPTKDPRFSIQLAHLVTAERTGAQPGKLALDNCAKSVLKYSAPRGWLRVRGYLTVAGTLCSRKCPY